eukprot:CAMPEP_0205927682 /NCGR_PEP_ID=MMETSP1325-20131115/23121_1 /ASSEMBLY_ACC=CAM_ASM_000708 /TAXON_ID=236786 /ORGANISM="Florenciella sp., Strain RCC1007" /LENGTH=36 /DNA_ID= /DNA_START= /DNA_END= /DNA_ORIENTATION=
MTDEKAGLTVAEAADVPDDDATKPKKGCLPDVSEEK